METALKSHSNMKKKHVITIIYSSCLPEFLETFHETQLYMIFQNNRIDLAWIFHCFCESAFTLLLAIKRESSLILGNFCICYFRQAYVRY